MNGYQAEEDVQSVSEILPWLPEAIAHFHPASTYAKGRTPKSKSVEFAGFLIAFVCTHCGQSVKVEPPKPQ
jgi:hypothetical protein